MATTIPYLEYEVRLGSEAVFVRIKDGTTDDEVWLEDCPPRGAVCLKVCCYRTVRIARGFMESIWQAVWPWIETPCSV